jgi:acetyl esterase/lipase
MSTGGRRPPFFSRGRRIALLFFGFVAFARCSGGGGGGGQSTVPNASSSPSPVSSAMPSPSPGASVPPTATPTGTPTPSATPTTTPTAAPTAANYQVRATYNIPYGSDPNEILDAYVPIDGKVTRPAVMLVHGGESVSGDKSALASESLQIAQAGFTTFDLDYTLSTPTVPGYPTQGNQVQAAIIWVRANAAQYGVDPARIGALGSSHGGELVALVALEGSGSQQTGSRLMAAVTWSGPTDLVSLYAIECPGSTPSCLNKGEIEYFDCLYPQCPATFVAASPVTYIDSSDPPMEIFNSTNELVPLSQANELANGLTTAGVYNQLIVYPGSLHASAYSAQAIGPTTSFFETELYR